MLQYMMTHGEIVVNRMRGVCDLWKKAEGKPARNYGKVYLESAEWTLDQQSGATETGSPPTVGSRTGGSQRRREKDAAKSNREYV
jgi:hypothetical protein